MTDRKILKRKLKKRYRSPLPRSFGLSEFDIYHLRYVEAAYLGKSSIKREITSFYDISPIQPPFCRRERSKLLMGVDPRRSNVVLKQFARRGLLDFSLPLLGLRLKSDDHGVDSLVPPVKVRKILWYEFYDPLLAKFERVRVNRADLFEMFGGWGPAPKIFHSALTYAFETLLLYPYWAISYALRLSVGDLSPFYV